MQCIRTNGTNNFKIMKTIIITHYKNNNDFVNICFVENGVIVSAEQHHSQYISVAEIREI